MRGLVERFLSDESGLEMIEYAIMTSLIVVGLLAAIGSIAKWLTTRYEGVLEILGGGER